VRGAADAPVLAASEGKDRAVALAQLQASVREFIDAYNTEHRHASLAGMTPAEKWAT